MLEAAGLHYLRPQQPQLVHELVLGGRRRLHLRRGPWLSAGPRPGPRPRQGSPQSPPPRPVPPAELEWLAEASQCQCLDNYKIRHPEFIKSKAFIQLARDLEVAKEKIKPGKGRTKMNSLPAASSPVPNSHRNRFTSFPYFGVKLSCVCLMIAYRKKLPKVTQRWPNVTLRWPNVTLRWPNVTLRWPIVTHR